MKNPLFFTSLILFLILFLAIGIGTQAAQLGESLSFNIEASYDVSGRSELKATLVKISPKLYFYIDKNWWEAQTGLKQAEVFNSLESLSQEFERKIYPNLTSAFGSEWKPGIDGDERMTILIHQMKEGLGGYFRTSDEYLKLQSPESNEREMVYLAIPSIESPQPAVFLAHEFMHLITFNQKERILGSVEETWLNEVRAEYTSTFLDYEEPYEGSNLQRRVKDFLSSPTDSLTEWLNRKADYGVINLFIQYLVNHYGVGVLTDSLLSKEVGIPAINEALKKNGFKEDFSQIFTDWTIAVLVNNCSLGNKYCYLSKNLKDFRITPSVNFLPISGKSTLSVTNITKNWSGNWQKFIGGQGVLKFEFFGLAGLDFRIPYLIEDKTGKLSLDFLTLDEEQKGEIYIPDFGSKNRALIIIPSLQTKISDFNGSDPTYPFSFRVSIIERTPAQEAEFIKELLSQIEALKAEIAKAQTQINAILITRGQKISCQKLENDLYYGIVNNSEVGCLQEFLKLREPEIYPEGLVTGNFLSLTRAAVIRFQEKYASEILIPFGLEKGTGLVGQKTRAKINQSLPQP